MQTIPMNQAELDSWTAQYSGDRTDIFYDGESLNVPDGLFAAVAAVDVSLAPVIDPVSAEPVRIACALRIPVVNDEVQGIGGAFRVAAVMLLDTGKFMAVFSQNLGETEPFVIPNNGVSVAITEWGGDYAMMEVREHADGALITPSTFGFSLFGF